MTDIGFVQGQSDNLPKISALAMIAFFSKNPDFISAEIRNVKAERSGREAYGDNAIGYVQVKREGNLCIVKGKITPEHSVRKKPYNVELTFDEREEVISSAKCESCAAHLGGCKHTIAFVAWVHRKSTTPPSTSIECYWKKSKLSSVGSSIKFIKAKNLGNAQIPDLPPGDGTFLASVVDHSLELDSTESQLLKYYKDPTDVMKLSVHYLLDTFFKSCTAKTAESFLEFASENMSPGACQEGARATIDQATSPLWFELRYARITASKAYDAAHCKTLEGSLVESILGASKIKDTAAMKRGRLLEGQVLKEVELKTGKKFKNCGILLNKNHPVVGASPDGECDSHILEIKCPTSEKAIKRYITRNNEIAAKYLAQVQLQMHFSNKKSGLFCVASHDFENSKNVTILPIQYNESYCKTLIQKCTQFWSEAVFSLIKQNYE